MTATRLGRPLRPTPAEQSAIIAAYQAGDTVPALARQWRRGEKTIRRILRAAGIYDPANSPVFTTETRAEIGQRLAARYREGETVQQLADSIGVSYATCHDMLTEAGAEFRARAYTPQSAVARSEVARQRRIAFAHTIADQWRAGTTITALCKTTGRSDWYITRALTDAGLTTPRDSTP